MESDIEQLEAQFSIKIQNIKLWETWPSPGIEKV